MGETLVQEVMDVIPSQFEAEDGQLDRLTQSEIPPNYVHTTELSDAPLSRDEVLTRHGDLMVELNGEKITPWGILERCKHARGLSPIELNNMFSKIALDQVRKQETASMPRAERNAALNAKMDRLSKLLEEHDASPVVSGATTEQKSIDETAKTINPKADTETKPKTENSHSSKVTEKVIAKTLSHMESNVRLHDEQARAMDTQVTEKTAKRTTSKESSTDKSPRLKDKISEKYTSALMAQKKPKAKLTQPTRKDTIRDLAQPGLTPEDTIYITPPTEQIVNQIPKLREATKTIGLDENTVIERLFKPSTMLDMDLNEHDGNFETSNGESETQLSAEELLLVAEWAANLDGASAADFAEVPQGDESITEAEAASADTLLKLLPTFDIDTDIVADSAEAGVNLKDNSESDRATPESEPESVIALTEIIAEQAPAAVLAIEQIVEQVELLDQEALSEVHILLTELSETLQTIEQFMDNMAAENEFSEELETAATLESDKGLNQNAAEVADESLAVEINDLDGAVIGPELREMEAALTQKLQKLCDKLGLGYSEQQISMIVEQLLNKRARHATDEDAIDLDNTDDPLSNEITSNVDLSKGMHEALSWFLNNIKQLKKQTNWMHRFIGMHALSSFSGLLVSD